MSKSVKKSKSVNTAPAQDDVVSPEGKLIQNEARRFHKNRKAAKIQDIEEWYELKNDKLLHCKRSPSGTVYRVFAGNRQSKRNRPQLLAFIAKLDKQGRLTRV